MFLLVLSQLAEAATSNPTGALITLNLGALGINAVTLMVGTLRAGRVLEKVERHDTDIANVQADVARLVPQVAALEERSKV